MKTRFTADQATALRGLFFVVAVVFVFFWALIVVGCGGVPVPAPTDPNKLPVYRPTEPIVYPVPKFAPTVCGCEVGL